MKSKYKFAAELNAQQAAELSAIIASNCNARNKKRAQAISLSARGYTIDEISAIMECHRVTVSRWIDQWHEQGIDGLLEKEGRGRMKSLAEEEEKQVLEWLKSDERGTNGLLGKIEKVFGKKISVRDAEAPIQAQWKSMETGSGQPRQAAGRRRIPPMRTRAYRTHGGCCQWRD